jgi:hypothetical protein
MNSKGESASAVRDLLESAQMLILLAGSYHYQETRADEAPVEERIESTTAHELASFFKEAARRMANASLAERESILLEMRSRLAAGGEGLPPEDMDNDLSDPLRVGLASVASMLRRILKEGTL